MGRFTADNTNGPMSAFKLRKHAKYIYPDAAAETIDLVSLHGLYGKVTPSSDTCYLASAHEALSYFESNPTIFAVDFVVRAV